MKKAVLLFLFISLSISAQTISSSRWSDLFSYNNVLVIRETSDKLIAATENGIFFYSPTNGEIAKLSKANGLHEVKISAFDYNPQTETGLVGYQNGTLDVITPDGIFFIVDIPIATGFQGDKRINHISINGNQAVISSGYGVSVFDLERREFGDSAFFMTGGIFEPSLEAVIHENTVYAITSSGIKSHEINVTFPVFSTWQTSVAGSFLHLAQNGNTLAYANSNTVNYGGGALSGFSSITDLVVTPQNIVVSEPNRVSVYDHSGATVKTFNFNDATNTGYFSSNQVYAGTKFAGIVGESGLPVKPDGPYNNRSYKMDLVENQILISSGGRDSYNTVSHTESLGFYHFDGMEWKYPEFFINNPSKFNILDAVINPSNLSEIFFVNFYPGQLFKGIYRSEAEGGFAQIPNLSTNMWLYEPVGLGFDSNAQLFATYQNVEPRGSALAKSALARYNAASSQFNVLNIFNTSSAQKPFIQDNHIYIAQPFIADGSLIVYNYNGTASSGDDSYTHIDDDNNLPTNGVVSVTIDKNYDAWIGTRTGLRVLHNATSAVGDPTVQTDEIIIEENGLGEELFRDNNILQITTDGGNQKWVSVDGGGVFFLTANGERTISHFTKANSPLPTDNVTDIKVDTKTGKVYFVTYDGVVVYQGDVMDVNENFGDVLVYPNPVVHANYKGNVRIRGLAERTNIRITDAAGNLVHQAVVRGGYYEWDLNNHRGARVASGIYFVLMTNENGTDTATAKIAVVN